MPQQAQRRFSKVNNHNTPFGINRFLTYMPPSSITMPSIEDLQSESTSLLACVNVLPWIGKNTFPWFKTLQH